MATKNIHTILIANRGEIACRVIKTCKKLGIKTIAVFSDADKNALFVKLADEAYALGGNQPAETYLNQEKILDIAQKANVDAIHPGYGFLSENAAFAEKCAQNAVIFIGPNPKAIAAMGSKSSAKKLMIDNNLPTVPGYNGDDQTNETLTREADKIGYPVLLKASAGGGGKGMRIVRESSEMPKAISGAKSEAQSSFGDDRLIVEKYIENARHIEFQILGDQHGNTYHILERECSIQRRYQKVVEESPSPVLSEKVREQMGATAVAIAKTLAYDNAGTVEFVYSDKDESFYFLEVNTRLQVEHPVTELITGLDLVELQIQAAEGKEILLKQSEIKAKGYAVEVRLYAENPENNFMPETGKILHWETPAVDGLRIDTGIETGSVISTYYDPMIAKIIAHGSDRATAHRKMKYALENTRCIGLKTNQNFLHQLFSNDDVAKGNYSTKFLETKFDLKATELSEKAKLKSALTVTLKRFSERNDLNDTLIGWRNNFYQHQWDDFKFADDTQIKISYRKIGNAFEVLHSETKLNVEIADISANEISLIIDGKKSAKITIFPDDEFYYVHNAEIGNVKLQYVGRFPEKNKEKQSGGYRSPMPAEIISVKVTNGQAVKKGDLLVVLSSMKMQISIEAEEDGTIEEVFVSDGQTIEAGTEFLKFVK